MKIVAASYWQESEYRRFFFPSCRTLRHTGCILHHRKGPACGRGSRNRYSLFHDRLQRYSLYSM